MSSREYQPDEWRPIPGYEGSYEVSRFGVVRSLDRVIMRSNGVPQTFRGKVKVPQIKNTYYAVWLGKKPWYVHNLVLLAFVGPRPDDYQCCHNDGNPLNNNLENLRWDTRSANMLDTIRHGTHPTAFKDVCKSGHRFDEQNTYLRPRRAGRDCRECTRERGRKYRARQKRRAADLTSRGVAA